MKFFKIIFVVIALNFGIHGLRADEVAIIGAKLGEWTQDYDAAVKLAAEKDIPILMNFTGSDWCHWCIHMDEKVFAGEAWKKYAKENLVLVALDFPKDKSKVLPKYAERNERLKGEFGIRGFPTFVVLDSDNKSMLGMLSAGQDKTPESFVGETEELLRLSVKGIAKFKKENPDKAEAFQASIDGFKKLEGEWKTWIETRPEQTPENMAKHKDFMTRLQASHAKMKGFK